MQRLGVIGDIYGYLICLVAVLLFIHSGAGFVNSAFGFAGPAGMGRAHHPRMLFMMRGAPGGMHGWNGMRGGMRPGMGGNVFFKRLGPGGAQAQKGGAMAQTPALPNGAAVPNMQRTGRTAARGHRYLFAIRGLIVNLVLLVIAVLLFRWHWRWLQRLQPA